MLVLTRKEGEALVIDEEIEIHVLTIENNHVKIGIDAPKHISIHRKEIHLKINDPTDGNKI